jgi:transglutaminase-like putative cysteine protease
MPLFEPKIYKKNGLEAFRLAGSDGSEFFYEGALDCNEKELYKDALGRLYYPVIAEIGGAVKYFVELDPQVPAIPFEESDTREKAISRLVNASPRPESSLPEDIFVRPEAAQDLPLEVPEEDAPALSQEATPEMSQETPSVEPAPAAMPPEPAAEMPLPEPVEHRKSEEATSAIHAVFAPKVDILHPSVEDAGTVAPPEKKKPVEASPEKAPSRAKAPAKDGKKRFLKWPFAIAVVIIALLVASAVGVYLVKPGTYDPLRKLIDGPSPTPTPAPDEGTPSDSITGLIDSDNPLVASFARDAINASSSDDPLSNACDLFDLVNGRWEYSNSYATPRKASEIVTTLKGTAKDYTVLMTALMESQDIPCRMVFSYPADSLFPDYYPEVLAANTTPGSETAKQALHVRYGVVSPQGHLIGTDWWIALSMGEFPGTRPADGAADYALSGGTISPLR